MSARTFFLSLCLLLIPSIFHAQMVGPQTATQTGIQTTQAPDPQTANPRAIPSAKTPAGSLGQFKLVPVPMPTISPGALELIKLEGDFENSVAKGGGKAFASWFAEDAVTLNNGQPAVLGQQAIAASATWDPKTYQLTWYPEGAQMGPGGETGFTWGHYQASGKDPKGQPVHRAGRYITFWKNVGGHWKVALDASADDAPPIGVQP